MFVPDQKVGKYRIVRSLGSGGFGAVYLAEDELIGKQVALKVPHRQNLGMDALSAEAKLMAPLSHPNIVQVLTADQDPASGAFFIVMEYIAGESLAERLTRVGSLEEPKAIAISMEVVDAVRHAHANSVLHRDLRPSNVILTPEDQAKVLDFSISRLMDQVPYASTRIGSPPYMAPEHFQGRATFASDLYSVGVMMYEMVTGVLPFFDINPARIEELVAQGRFTPPNLKNRRVSKEFSDIVVRAMARDLSQRYRTAAELLEDLRRLKSTTRQQREISDIRQRIAARDPGRDAVCFNCRKPLPRRATHCPFCRAKQ